TRQAAKTRQGLRASKQQQLEQVLKQARAIGKSKGKKALRQWLEDNYDEATIKELTGRLFPSFVSPSKRGMA
ncbi:MAG: hypothetical protein N0C82_20455, partial [Candidatus Thiodiazotropha endolucinida]|nr:hypothetical protein [Candidatus Thiodiazotropha taylori]MCW4297677.1 hypothetical protein [Candidatus Thiodiazotropha endolucinida]